ncbi:TenA family protein [Lichenihabitans sp. Uapishka_5]|uniref:TenA family protein n=1 Tax=Lichenihabitans sp. Uapishka_5 TaxID=3037302 RepID=UPI0029E819BB|nr:TenA family protein [Lichenihabitans sp. Uapishka_5]MDX7950968.1 TenA family protein [Lichenihabitans sp. Uapishka_5]
MTSEIDFRHGFFGRLRAAAGDQWTGYVGHPFVRQLGAGTLPEACFRRFLVQDYLFLVQFGRAYGLAAYKSTSLADIRVAAAGLGAVLAEIPLHVGYCAGWGLSEAEMAAEPEAAETMTYTRYVTDIGHTGDLLDLTVALMPCVAGYAEVGQTLLADPATVLEGSPYGAWLRNYDSEDYKAGVRLALDKLEDLSRRYAGEARFASLSRIFTTATRLESAFWQMGLDAAPR